MVGQALMERHPGQTCNIEAASVDCKSGSKATAASRHHHLRREPTREDLTRDYQNNPAPPHSPSLEDTADAMMATLTEC